MTMMRQQTWSTETLKKIQSIANATHPSINKPKYKTHCKKAAGLIQRSGLIQAICFLLCRSNSEMGDHFCNDLAQVYGYKDGKNLLEKAQHAQLPQYISMSRDVIEIAIWFRRFAQIEMANIEESMQGED